MSPPSVLDPAESDIIVLVDDVGTPIGTANKLASHHANTPLHLAFSCYIFNDKGELLVTKRADHKKVWPGVWTNSVCGHPAPGEELSAAIVRRAAYELGMTVRDITIAVSDYTYKAPAFNGVIEHEYCPIYCARMIDAPQPNPLEVGEYKWLSWTDFLQQAMNDTDDEWSWWCKDQLRLLRDHPVVQTFIS